MHFDDVLVEVMEYEESFGPYSPTESPNIRETSMLLTNGGIGLEIEPCPK